MRNQCEVCKSFRPEGHPRANGHASEVSFGSRRVLLCSGHARIAKNSDVQSLEELRALYAESQGRRSFVARRAPAASDRRPSERRRVGRRASDAR